MKDDGTWVSKKDKKKQAEFEAKRANLIAQGLIKIDEDGKEVEVEAKGGAVSTRRRKNKKKEEKKEEEPVQEVEEKKEEEEKPVKLSAKEPEEVK